jgi:fumarate reductase flavoprotein subunit
MQMHSHVEAENAGALKVCNTAAEIAKVIGCDAATVAQTLAEVESYAAGKAKDPFGRDFSAKPPLKAPYRVVKIMGALFHTQGGLEVNKEMRVLRGDGTPFPNLFAGGGAARGLSGPADWGYLSGSGLLTATNMGRLAGEAAAALIRK